MNTYQRVLGRLMTDSIDVGATSQRLPEFSGSRCVTLRADEANTSPIIVYRDDDFIHLYPGWQITYGLHDRPCLSARSFTTGKLLYRAS